MTNAFLLIIPLQVILIFFLSRLTINELFYFLRIFFKKEATIYGLVSLFFLPGTIIHEFGHFLAATILGLSVYEVQILPKWEKKEIKLGSVLYGKKDFFRAILVGIAPFFFALIFFWFLAKFNLFPNQSFWSNLILGYVVFTVSSMMFSSKKDLVDLVLIVPVIIIIIGIIYIFNLNIDFLLKNKIFKEELVGFFKEISFYFLISIVINLILIFIFKSFRYLIRK